METESPGDGIWCLNTHSQKAFRLKERRTSVSGLHFAIKEPWSLGDNSVDKRPHKYKDLSSAFKLRSPEPGKNLGTAECMIILGLWIWRQEDVTGQPASLQIQRKILF